MDENLRDCLLKFVVLDFDRFSRSEFVAEVLVPLGDLGDLREGVTICEELMLQQKVMVRDGGSFISVIAIGSIRDDPYWTSRKNSLELIELSSTNKVR